MIDYVNKFAVSNMTISTQRDFKSEYLFRTCSVATNLVMWLEFNPIHCATMLCYFGQTRSGYVAILFILRGSTATSSATGDYVAIPERFGRNEEPAGGNQEWTKKKPSLFPKVDLTDALALQTCNHDFFFYIYLISLILMNFIIISHEGKSNNFLFML